MARSVWRVWKGKPELVLIVQNFLNAGFSYREVGKRMGVKRDCVYKFCRALGLHSEASPPPPPKRVRKSDSRNAEYCWRYRMKKDWEERLIALDIFKKPYVLFDIKGQPHISSTLVPRQPELVEHETGNYLLSTSRITGEPVRVFFRVDRLEEQRSRKEKDTPPEGPHCPDA